MELGLSCKQVNQMTAQLPDRLKGVLNIEKDTENLQNCIC